MLQLSQPAVTPATPTSARAGPGIADTAQAAIITAAAAPRNLPVMEISCTSFTRIGGGLRRRNPSPSHKRRAFGVGSESPVGSEAVWSSKATADRNHRLILWAPLAGGGFSRAKLHLCPLSRRWRQRLGHSALGRR